MINATDERERRRRQNRGAPAYCIVHGEPCRAHVRGVCQAIWKKWKEAGVPLPPTVVAARGRGNYTQGQLRRHMRAWIQRLPEASRAMLRALLAEEMT